MAAEFVVCLSRALWGCFCPFAGAVLAWRCAGYPKSRSTDAAPCHSTLPFRVGGVQFPDCAVRGSAGSFLLDVAAIAAWNQAQHMNDNLLHG